MADEQDRAEMLDDDAQPVVAAGKSPGAEPHDDDPGAEPPAEEDDVSDPGGDSDPDPAS